MSESDIAKAEASRRVRQALERIEIAQEQLYGACADLSALVGGTSVWSATSKLGDRVKALWYRVDGFRARGRFRLDDTNVAALERRLAAESRGQQSQASRT